MKSLNPRVTGSQSAPGLRAERVTERKEIAHSLKAMQPLDTWLLAHVGDADRRAAVRANADCLSDFKVVSRDDLEEALGLSAWPKLAQERFLDAVRRLKDGDDGLDDGEDAGESDVGDEAPRRRGGPPPRACEVRRVGDDKWRRFASRKDAVKAFPDLNNTIIKRLINDPTTTSARAKYEARNVDGSRAAVQYSSRRAGGSSSRVAAQRDGADGDDASASEDPDAPDSDSDDEDDEPDDAGEGSGGRNKTACEARRVGNKNWRRFASRADAARAFPKHKYETRNAVDASDSAEAPPVHHLSNS